MITSVGLENWKAYRSFKLQLEPGTTFLVAANGVGKTSLIHAVQWALDRHAASTRNLMRLRSETASVDLELVVDGVTVRIKRSLHVGRARTPTQQVQAWVDGIEVEPDDAYGRLEDAWRADNKFACRAAFLSDRFLDDNTDPDLRSHLARLHSLDRIQDAISALKPAIKRAADEAADAKKGARADAAARKKAVVDAETARAFADTTAQRAEELRTLASTVEQALQAGVETNAECAAYDAWAAAFADVTADAEQLLGPLPGGVTLDSFLRSAEAGAARQLLEMTEQRARLTERVASLEESLRRLQNSEGVCPVCRQPLDDESRGHAEQEHLDDRERAAAELEQLAAESSASVAETLRELTGRVAALGERPAEPVREPVDLTALRAVADAAKRSFEQALGTVGEARRAAADASALAAELAAQAGKLSPAKLYARAAALESARDALDATVTEVLRSQLGPVAEEVNRRWRGVFPDRHDLHLGSDGRITRGSDESALEFLSFSAGEQVVAKLLLRLATLTSTTDVPFCWIDEPLEHLDPDARRFVARTLAYLSSGSGLRQIFVSTYEQDLALQLADDSPDQVHLEFLRTSQVAD